MSIGEIKIFAGAQCAGLIPGMKKILDSLTEKMIVHEGSI
jgi:hypothetical protein